MRISYLSTTICVIDITISSNQLILFTEINHSSLSTVRKLVNYILDEIQSRHIMTSYVTRFEILLINIINGFLIYYEKNNVYCDFFFFLYKIYYLFI